MSRLWEYGIGILLAPIACFFGDCGGGLDLAQEYNPVEELEGMIPGIGNWKSSQFTGLWHFIDQNSSSVTERFNDPPGMYYEARGPDGVPGALDVGIMIFADATGLSVRADESDGVGRYGDYDDHHRSKARWQAHSIGHTEFSPIDNRAHWGWNKVVNDPTSARWLGHPLHALGDVAMPQHLVSTTSWGHRPYEDAQGDDASWLEALGYDVEGAAPDKFLEQGIASSLLRAGYWLWKDYVGSDGDVDIEGLVTSLAAANRSTYPDSSFQDALSVEYFVLEDDAVAAYLDLESNGSNFADINRRGYVASLGGMITLLTAAAKHVGSDGGGPSCHCPAGTHYSGRVVGHAEDTNAATFTPLPMGGNSGSNAYDTLAYWEVEGCVAGAPVTMPTECPEQKEPGEGCADDTECTTDLCLFGNCAVPTGPSGPFEPGTICDDDSQCDTGICNVSTHRCAVCDDDQDCVTLRCFKGECSDQFPAGHSCDVPEECQSWVCWLGICRGRLGDICAADQQCISGFCLDGVCVEAKWPNGHECLFDEQCASGECISGLCGESPK